MSTIEVKMGLWLTNYGLEHLAKGEEPKRGDLYLTDGDMEDSGWFKLRDIVHTVQVSELPDKDTAIRMAVEALEAEKRRIYLEAQKKVAKIDEQLSKLQSLTYEVPATKEHGNDVPF